jgi:predicted dehydrogenase
MNARVALVGAGRMGTNHARVIAASPEASLAVIVDRDRGRAELLASLTGAPASSDLEDALACDAAVVATNVESHLEIATALMEAGVPVLVEKPLAGHLKQATTMVTTSRRLGVPMACGFVERFNPVVRTALRQMQDYGPALHVVGVRHSPRDAAGGVSVIQDLLIHDVDLALLLCAGDFQGSVTGGTWLSPQTGVAEIADCTIQLSGGAMATCSASRMSQRKVRSLTLATERALLELDLLRRTITVYQHVGHLAALDDAGYRAQTVMDLPFVRENGEPLALQLAHFLALARGEADPEAERATLLAPHEVLSALDGARQPFTLESLAVAR